MSNKIDDSGDGFIPLSCRALIRINTNEAAIGVSADGEPIEGVKEVEAVCPGVHTNLFAGIRNSISSVVSLRKFVSWLSQKSGNDQNEKTCSTFSEDPALIDLSDSLIKNYSKKGIDLVGLLKSALIKSNDFNEKVIYIKMLVSMGKEDEFLSAFFVGALEKKNGFENIEYNYEFCSKFFALQDEITQRRILSALDYTSIYDVDTFAKSLLRIAYPDLVLDVLIDNLKGNDTPELDENKEALRKEKIQKVLIVILKELNDASYAFSKDHLESFYKMSVNNDIGKEISELLVSKFPQDALRIFKDGMHDKSDFTDSGRIRRFHAIYYFAKNSGAYAVNAIKNFIKQEDDPFLIAHACYVLANNCGIDGKRALTSLIVNQIRGSEPSLLLAALSLLTKYGEPYLDIFKNVLIRNYSQGCDLKQAFTNLQEVQISDIYKDNEGTLRFQLQKDYRPELVIDLINNIGLEKFVTWAAFGEGKNEKEVNNFKRNTLDILDYAWQINSERMKQLTIELSMFATPYTRELLFSLVGVKGLAMTSSSQLS